MTPEHDQERRAAMTNDAEPKTGATIEELIRAEAALAKANEKIELLRAERDDAHGHVRKAERERDEARAAIHESREFMARVARAYTQWMDAIGPRDTFAFPKDAEEHNGIVKHMHDMMALLVEFSEKCPPVTRTLLGEGRAEGGGQ